MKAIDLGLMANHLKTHDAVITKLKRYYCSTNHPNLKEILALQIAVMESHVKVMLLLISPSHHGYVTVPTIEQIKPFQATCQPNSSLSDQDIALEAHSTAKSQAGDNFSSALFMQNKNVKEAHFHMAYQQARILEWYGQFIKKMGWKVDPSVSDAERIKTIQQYQALSNRTTW
ncbi:hypothetical protein ACFYKX_03240 [Cytobacillus sp. FJAT-54145]|uniref:Spore coat protein n=1 Tax=Cytobacillus spartinae TaxID=3299023 RepID=A0ABW6K8M8_9BACI